MSDTDEVTRRLAAIREQLSDAFDHKGAAHWDKVAGLCAGIADDAREAMKAADRIANRGEDED